MAPLTEFVQQLMAEQGLRDVGPEVRAQLEADAMQGAIDLINRRLIDAMSKRDVQRFNLLLGTNPNPQAVQSFIELHVPNREQVTASALLEFRQFYLGSNR